MHDPFLAPPVEQTAVVESLKREELVVSGASDIGRLYVPGEPDETAFVTAQPRLTGPSDGVTRTIAESLSKRRGAPNSAHPAPGDGITRARETRVALLARQFARSEAARRRGYAVGPELGADDAARFDIETARLRENDPAVTEADWKNLEAVETRLAGIRDRITAIAARRQSNGSK